MDERPLLVLALVNGISTSQALVDSGCLVYGIVSDRFVRRHHLSYVQIEPRHLQLVEGVSKDAVSRITSFDLDISGHQQKRVYFYVVPKVEGYKIILGKS